MSNSYGFVKTLFNSETGEVLGAHLIGPDVTEMIATFGLLFHQSQQKMNLLILFLHIQLYQSLFMKASYQLLKNLYIFKHDQTSRKIKKFNPTTIKNLIG